MDFWPEVDDLVLADMLRELEMCDNDTERQELIGEIEALGIRIAPPP